MYVVADVAKNVGELLSINYIGSTFNKEKNLTSNEKGFIQSAFNYLGNCEVEALESDNLKIECKTN